MMETIPVGTRSTPIVTAGDGVTLIQNGDVATTIYIGSDNSVTVANTQSNVPLTPNSFLIVDGDDDVWAISASGIVLIHKIPGGLGFFQSGISGASFLINKNGVFIYNTTLPTANGLAASIAPVGGTDPVGNAYLSGFTTYQETNLNTFIAMNITTFAGAFYAGAINLEQATTYAGPYSSTSTALYFRNQIIEVSAPELLVDGLINSTAGTQASPTLITTDTWHSLGNLGVAGISLSQARYRLDINGQVQFDISGAATGSVAASQTQFPNTLPAAYQPARERDIPVLFAAVANRLRVQANGNVFLGYPALSNGNTICGNGWCPLD